MRVLLTNDDGYEAPGLRALYDAVNALPGVAIDVIAPVAAQSGKAHATTGTFTCRPMVVERMGRILVVDGTPADCVRAALHLPGRPQPDWVIAGINRGSNLGVDVYYSGTVAAVREAAILGVPAIAISQLVKPSMPDDWSSSQRQAAAIIAAICLPYEAAPSAADPEVHRLARIEMQGASVSAMPLFADQPVAPVRPVLDPPRPKWHTPPCWNVNLPRPPDNRPLGVRIAPLSTDPPAFTFNHAPQDDEKATMTYVDHYHQRPAAPGTDVALAFRGYITISRLRLG